MLGAIGMVEISNSTSYFFEVVDDDRTSKSYAHQKAGKPSTRILCVEISGNFKSLV